MPGPFIYVPLYTQTGDYVSMAEIEATTPPAEEIMWGVRLFTRDQNGNYIEGLAGAALLQQPLPPVRFNP